MVWDQRPGIATCSGFFQDISESSQKIIPVGIILEYSPSFNTPGNDVVEGSRSIYSRFSRHANRIACLIEAIKLNS